MPSKQALAAAVEAASDGVEGHDPTIVTLGSGVVLRLKPVAPLLIRRAAAGIPVPEVPKVFLEDKGREEENPDDPEYKRAVLRYTEEVEEAGTLLMLAAGTEILHIPEEVDPPDGENWLPKVEEILAYTGSVDFSKDKMDTRIGRYLVWLQYYAMTSLEDLVNLLSAVAGISGVSEEAVAKAIASFRSGTVGGEADGLPATDSGDRDNV